MQEYQKAYLAGFIDADGCISVSRVMRNKTNKKYYYQGQVNITNCNKEILELLNSWIQIGKIHEQIPKNKSWRTTYHLRINFQNGAELLKIILPYLVLKQPQAKLYIELHQLKKGQVGKHDNPYIQKLDRYESIFQQMKSLNKRGKSI